MQYEKRNDGLDDFSNHYKTDTVNYAVNSTLMASNVGKRMDFVWSHSYHEILMPGMPVRMHWEKDRATVTVYGVLLFSHTIILNQGKVNNNDDMVESGKFDSKTFMSVYVVRPPDEL